jgi:phosphoenolpyruvate carboxykinase (GTP)
MPPVYVARTADEGVVIGASIVSKATATEIGATGVKRSPWANQPFIPGALGDYMDAQFSFFNNPKIKKEYEPVMAGLNYFLTHEARGGSGTGLIGEKRDVHVWMGWLERRAHKEVDAIETPIGYIPTYRDLQRLFQELLGKTYSHALYILQFSLYIDRILARITLQENAYSTEENIPSRLWNVYTTQKRQLQRLRDTHGPIVPPESLRGQV